MAFYSGFGGAVSFGGSAVAQVKNWSSNINLDDKDNTYMGLKWEAHGGGLASWGATITCFLEYTTGQKGIVDGLLTATPTLTSVAMILTMASGKTITGNVIPTSVGIPVQVKDNIEITFTVKGDGAPTWAWA
jgi:hypothetical protein